MPANQLGNFDEATVFERAQLHSLGKNSTALKGHSFSCAVRTAG
jgi:hypothetical protein